MTDNPTWPDQPPRVPDGWVAIPKAAMLFLESACKVSDLEKAVMRDPDAPTHRNYRIRRMFQEMAMDLLLLHDPFVQEVGDVTKARVVVIDPRYVAHRDRVVQAQQQQPQPVLRPPMMPTAATPKPEGADHGNG